MVEDTIKNNDNSAVTIAELKRDLPRQVHHDALMQILHYLEERNHISMTLKGIVWVKPMSVKMRKQIESWAEH